jgi:hypothetical protein
VITEAKRIEEDTLYSSKRHFEAAAIWNRVNLSLGLPSAIVSALAGASALSTFDHHGEVAAFLALFVAAATGTLTFLNPSDRASTHQAFGNRYNELRNRSRIFAELEAPGAERAELLATLGELNALRDALNGEAPQAPKRAFERARKGIEAGEANYVADAAGNGIDTK